MTRATAHSTEPSRLSYSMRLIPAEACLPPVRLVTTCRQSRGRHHLIYPISIYPPDRLRISNISNSIIIQPIPHSLIMPLNNVYPGTYPPHSLSSLSHNGTQTLPTAPTPVRAPRRGHGHLPLTAHREMAVVARIPSGAMNVWWRIWSRGSSGKRRLTPRDRAPFPVGSIRCTIRSPRTDGTGARMPDRQQDVLKPQDQGMVIAEVGRPNPSSPSFRGHHLFETECFLHLVLSRYIFHFSSYDHNNIHALSRKTTANQKQLTSFI